MILITKHTIKINKVKFKIIIGRKGNLIQFKDENNKTLHWTNTIQNQVLVSNMVDELETRVESC